MTRSVVCWIMGHNLGDVMARYKAGDVIHTIPTEEQIKKAVECGATQILTRLLITCLRCGKLVEA